MSEETKNLDIQAAALTTGASSSVIEAQIVRPEPIRSARKSEQLKKIAWRVTAAGYWLWWIVSFFLGSEPLHRVSSAMMAGLVAFLSSVGFTPSHSEYLPKILRFGWLLTIVGFNPIELLGLWIYVCLAPLTLLIFFIFKDYGKDLRKAQTEKKGLRPPKVKRPAVTTFSLLLLGWFVLYGEASSRRPLMAGAILSGLLFLSLASRTFQRVRPPIHASTERTGITEVIATPLFTGGADAIVKAQSAKAKSEMLGSLFMYQKARFIWRNLALLMRGEAGRNRLYLLLLADYVISFLVLGTAAILFWAILDKTLSVPTTQSLGSFIHLSSSYLMPNIKSPLSGENLPLWAQMGSSITSFVLLVLFVGAAASLLPSRYLVYAERLKNRYFVNRKFALQFKKVAVAIERIKQSKPT